MLRTVCMLLPSAVIQARRIIEDSCIIIQDLILEVCSNLKVHSVFDKVSFIIPYAGNLAEVKSCMFNEISCMVFLVTSVSMLNNFIATFTKPETFTFLNNTVINCLMTKEVPYKEICYKKSRLKKTTQ
jgi:hypothetical protein